MKIHCYETEQFAGVRSQKVKFEDGMNVVLGQNETGKSTMLSAIFHALFTSSKLDRRKNKDFITSFFPTSGAKTIDAVVEIEKEETYTIEKIWDIDGKENVTRVREKDGDLWRGAQAEQKLAEVLDYNISFYRNIVFDNQKYEEEILDWFYRFFSDKGSADEEIADIKTRLAEAFSVAQGISEEKFLSLLDSKMRELSGKWDFKKDAPEKGRGIENKWKRETGIILESYYAYEEVKRELEEARKIEEELAQKTRQLAELTKEKDELQEERQRIEAQKAEIFNKSKTEKLLKNVESELETCLELEVKWPNIEEKLCEGEKLANWQRIIDLMEKISLLEEKIDAVRKLSMEVSKLKNAGEAFIQISSDYEKAKKVSAHIERHQLKLSGIKLLAEISLKNLHDTKNVQNIEDASNIEPKNVEVKNIKIEDARGEKERKEQESMLVKEEMEGFVKISISGIADIQVSPKEIDVEKCQREIRQNESLLRTILDCYKVSDLEELSEKKIEWREREYEREQKERQLQNVLDNNTIDDFEQEKSRLLKLQEEYEKYQKEEGEKEKKASLNEREINKIKRNRREIKENIQAFLKRERESSIEASVASARTLLIQYKNLYGSYENLKKRIKNLDNERAEYKKQLQSLEKIVMTEQQYGIKIQNLQRQLKETESKRDVLTSQIGSLTEKERFDMEEMQLDILKRKKAWEKNKKTYDNYEQIKEDFLELKKEKEDKLEQFYNSFCENLAVITENKIKVDQFEGLEFVSGKNKILMKEILSEGTKKTVLLAFRLAMLQYFYRNEKNGGVAFFDDTLLDMDTRRRKNAVLLLEKFAQKNQVIFLTCDEKIAKMFNGNLIEMF